MSDVFEIPDETVVFHAEEFLAIAELALDNIPDVVAPSALRCNAAISIELFIKSLNSRWVDHDFEEELGGHVFTSKPNEHGHRLDKLFTSLRKDIKNQLVDAFSDCSLSANGVSLQSLLTRYRETFVTERYSFETPNHQSSHTLREIVELARFFRRAVRSMPTLRF